MNNKTLDALSKILLVIFAFILLLFSIESKAQTFTVTKCNMHDHYVIDFIDEFDDTCLQPGPHFLNRYSKFLSLE